MAKKFKFEFQRNLLEDIKKGIFVTRRYIGVFMVKSHFSLVITVMIFLLLL